ncbi:hypothetical protein C9F11_46245 (plasmid) [Streptomyces sp. YIM 121038]|nr:hypothetical protein C9F11_46245 [Streptomyces sp. YIM 121038]
MLDEAHWRDTYRRSGPRGLPGLERYLCSARHTLGGPSAMHTALVTLADHSTPEHLTHLLRCEQHASLALRRANDLRSCRRELGEGTVNPVLRHQQARLLCGAPLEAALSFARAAVWRRVEEHLAQCRRLGRQRVTETGWPEAALAGMTERSVRFYRAQDFLPHEGDTPPWMRRRPC